MSDTYEKSPCQQRELLTEANEQKVNTEDNSRFKNGVSKMSNEMLYEQIKLLQERIATLETRAGVFAGQFDLVNTSITNITQTVNMLQKNLYKEISESLIAVVHKVLGS